MKIKFNDKFPPKSKRNAGQKIAWIISYTPVAKEPRVIRQAKALEEVGWKVCVFGLAGLAACPGSWLFVDLATSVQNSSKSLRINIPGANRFLRLVGSLIARFGPHPIIRFFGARLNFRGTPTYVSKSKTILEFYKNNPEYRPNLVLCHDYFTTDIAQKIGRLSGAAVVVDCHEYAMGQFVHSARWMRWHRPVVKAVQDHLYPRLHGITTVCDGIADLITAEHRLGNRACVVRSTPFYSKQKFKSTPTDISVLYHGEIFPTRMLHVAVRSLRLWRPEFRLILRGNADPAYVQDLWRIADAVGVTDRLSIEPAVPFEQIIPMANRADVGYFVHNDLSPQRRFTLPNKFFEYVMAGLCVVVSDLPEMARLVREYEFGLLVNDCEEEAIAKVINSLDHAAIDKMKRLSLEAAKQLNWENEKLKMLSYYRNISS